jgi:EAL domain-containing protein (putative c-di-GMP-specific phosphodiesterase class I)/ABC-type amino acid transport substrate-binding protein/GGDEF domain-containing protein
MPATTSRDRNFLFLAALVLAAAVVAFVLPAPRAATAQAAHAHSARTRPIVFAGDSHYPPFDYLDEQSRPAGFDVDLIRAVARHAGLKVDIRLDTWERVVADLQAGKVDVAPMLVTPARKQRVRFSHSFLHRYHLAFGRSGGAYVGSLAELAGRRVVAQRAGMAWEELARIPGVRMVGVDNEGDALLAVQHGRADYALVPMYVGYEAQRRLKLDEVVALSPAFLETDYAFAVRPGNEALLERLNVGLRETTRSGELSRLYVRWLANLVPPKDSYRSGLLFAAWIALPLLLLATVLLVGWRRARMRAEAQALHLESHDPVTQLANRAGFRRALAPLVAAGQPFAVIRVDLIDIGAVEAMAGHAFVDELLLALAQRLLQHHALVAKINDRGFILAAPGVADGESAHATMRCVLGTLNQRIEIAGLPIEQIGCAGAALFPEHGSGPEELMRAAGLACEEACLRPGSEVLYQPAFAPDARRLTLLTDLRAAIREGTLGYALQPKLQLASQRVCGAEMLVRWRHPTHGKLVPAEFVPLAERTGVIGEMTFYLVERAVALCREWRARDLELTLSVNVSVNDLSDTAVVDRIVAVAAPVRGMLMLEVTETAVMRDPDKAFAAVERLRAGGLRMSLDDFGTGNASLTYLRRLAPEEVKVDRSFITGLMHSEADRSIVRSTIALAHSVQAMVTAEGVEDRETMAWLIAAGCDAAQGHHVGRPMEAAAFLERVLREAADRVEP